MRSRALLAVLTLVSLAIVAAPASASPGFASCPGATLTSPAAGVVRATWNKFPGTVAGHVLLAVGPVGTARSGEEISRGPARGTDIGGLTPGATYQVVVAAIVEGTYSNPCLLGSVEVSAPVSPSRPAAPTAAAGDAEVTTVSWVDTTWPGTAGVRSWRFYVESLTTYGFLHGRRFDLPYNQRSMALPALTPGETYRFYVQPIFTPTAGAVVFGALSLASSDFLVLSGTTPSRPTGLSVAQFGTEIDLAWTYVGPNLTSQRLEIVSEGLRGGEVLTLGPTVRKTRLTGLSDATGYSIRVRGVNAAGAGPWSAAVDALLPTPPAPSLVSATPVTGGAVDLRWTRTARDVQRYELLIHAPSWAARAGETLEVAASGTRVGRLTPGVEYGFQVRAAGLNGLGAWGSIWTVITSGSSGFPAMPSPVVEQITADSVRVSWPFPTAGPCAPQSGVRVCSVDVLGVPDQGAVVSRRVAAEFDRVVFHGLVPDRTYVFMTATVSPTGRGAYSPGSSATLVQNPAPVFPAIPSGLTASSIGHSSVSLSWSYSGPTLTSQRLEFSVPSRPDLSGTVYVAPGARTFTITELAPDTAYSFRVRGVNTFGMGSWSAPLEAPTVAYEDPNSVTIVYPGALQDVQSVQQFGTFNFAHGWAVTITGYTANLSTPGTWVGTAPLNGQLYFRTTIAKSNNSDIDGGSTGWVIVTKNSAGTITSVVPVWSTAPWDVFNVFPNLVSSSGTLWIAPGQFNGTAWVILPGQTPQQFGTYTPIPKS
jgi:hypothetical protein